VVEGSEWEREVREVIIWKGGQYLERGAKAEEKTRRRTRGRDNAFNYCGILWRDEKEKSSRTNERNTQLRIQIDANE